MILNKSSVKLTSNDKLLLMNGLKFAPTPSWSEITKNAEWKNFHEHIRRIERGYVFKNKSCVEMSENIQNLPNKLCIPKFSRPDQDLLDSETKTYCQSITSKLQIFKNKVNFHFHQRNNLKLEVRISLKHLSQLVKTNKIVICKADKDGKIVIVDYKDYQKITEAELEQFEILNDWNIDNKKAKFDVVMEQCYNKMIELYSLGEIKDNVLFHNCGIKNYNRFYKKVSGPTAKYFACYNFAYEYPLFKTHKLNKDQLLEVDILDIPRRFLQSAGDITSSRITAFLKMIFKPISTNYCQFQLNEYCRDSKHCLMELENWKSTQSTNPTSTLFINTADVKSLYPSVNRDLIPIALKSMS